MSGNTDNNINDLPENLYDLNNTVTDLSRNLFGIKATNTLEELKLFVQGAQISVNTDAIDALGGIVTTNVATTGANTVIIAGIIGTLEVSSTTIVYRFKNQAGHYLGLVMLLFMVLVRLNISMLYTIIVVLNIYQELITTYLF